MVMVTTAYHNSWRRSFPMSPIRKNLNIEQGGLWVWIWQRWVRYDLHGNMTLPRPSPEYIWLQEKSRFYPEVDSVLLICATDQCHTIWWCIGRVDSPTWALGGGVRDNREVLKLIMAYHPWKNDNDRLKTTAPYPSPEEERPTKYHPWLGLLYALSAVEEVRGDGYAHPGRGSSKMNRG